MQPEFSRSVWHAVAVGVTTAGLAMAMAMAMAMAIAMAMASCSKPGGSNADSSPTGATGGVQPVSMALSGSSGAASGGASGGG